jgi:hypothetical protein
MSDTICTITGNFAEPSKLPRCQQAVRDFHANHMIPALILALAVNPPVQAKPLELFFRNFPLEEAVDRFTRFEKINPQLVGIVNLLELFSCENVHWNLLEYPSFTCSSALAEVAAYNKNALRRSCLTKGVRKSIRVLAVSLGLLHSSSFMAT